MDRDVVREPKKTSVEPTIGGDILAIEQRLGSDIILDSLNPREEYLKSEPVKKIVDIQIGLEPTQVTKVGSSMGHDRSEDLEFFC